VIERKVNETIGKEHIVAEALDESRLIELIMKAGEGSYKEPIATG
jgi:hypothetical protein